MKPEQQRIAIAEACKTHKVDNISFDSARITVITDLNGSIKSITRWVDDECEVSSTDLEWVPILDYLSDLNAMHEVVKTLPQNLKPRYFAHLCTVVSGAISLHGYSEATEATAAQRAEAFLKTIGKWVES